MTGNFRRVCDRVGLTGVRLHDLRHLHATQPLADGVPVRTVSGRLGHANTSTTLNVYAHLLEVVEPDPEALATQLDVERAVAQTHLQSILDTYWDRDWRRDNRYGTSPEDQLWRAATALTEIDSALDDLTR